MKVYISDYSAVKADRHYDKGIYDLAYEAYKQISPSVESKGLDTLIISSSFSLHNNLNLGVKVASKIGIPAKRIVNVEGGLSSSGQALMVAESMIKSGLASSVLILGVEKVNDNVSKKVNRMLSYELDSLYEGFYGVNSTEIAALIHKSYMRKYKVSKEYFYSWPLLMHARAQSNPKACLPFKVTREAISSSQDISSPLKLFDLSPLCDGATSAFLTSEFRGKGIELMSIGVTNYFDNYWDMEKINYVVKSSFNQSLENAKISKEEVSLLEITDSYSVMAALELEATGLYEQGKSLEQVESNSKVNLGGGLKARGNIMGATGLYQLHDALNGLNKGEIGVIINTSLLAHTSYSIVVKNE